MAGSKDVSEASEPTVEARSERGRRHRRRRAPERRVERTPADRAVEGLLAATVVGSMLAVGTVHVPVLLVVAAVALAATLVAVWIGLGVDRRLVLSAPAGVFFGLAAFTALQAVPLPMGWLEHLAPANADVWRRCLSPFGEPGPRFASVSLDPGASWAEALKWFTYGGAFVAAAVVAARRGAAWGIGLVFVSALVAAVTTIGHGLVGATKVFGVYEAHFQVAPWHVGPLLNPNNLAGYLNLGTFCGIGLLLGRRPIAPRWLVVCALAAIVGVTVTSASRAGFAVVPAGVVLLALVRRRGRAAGGWGRWQVATVLVAVVVAFGGLLAFLGGTSDTWRELFDKDASKLAMLAWMKPLVAQHPWFGIGRGAFESVFPAYRPAPGNVVFTHAENFVAQWASEWGVVVTALALVLFGATLVRPAVLDVRRSTLAAGAWVGVVVLLAQNWLDLGLEVPAVCLAAAVVLGSLWGVARARRLGPEPRAESAPIVPLAGFAVAGALLLVLTGWRAIPDLAEDRERIVAELDVRADRRAQLRETVEPELHAAMLRHPAEPWFPLIGAYVTHRTGEGNPLAWLSRSLERATMNGRAHLLLAEVLAPRSPTQALMELRLAVSDDPALASAAAALAVRCSKDPEELAAVAPTGVLGAPMIEAEAAALSAATERDARRRLFEEVLARDPSRAWPHEALGWDRVTALAPSARTDECADERRAWCEREVEEHAKALEALDPESSRGARLRASLLAVQGKGELADRLLAERCQSASDRAACLRHRAQIDSDARLSERLAAALKEAVAAGCGSPERCAEASTWAGDLLASRGDLAGAVTYYGRATREQATEGRWLKLADAAGRLGTPAQAADALEKVAQLRGGGDAELRKKIAEYRAAALERMVGGER